MSEPIDHFKALCVQAGVTEEKPLHAVLLILFRTATMAEEAVKGGARGLSAEGEKELIYRMAENCVSVTGQEIERLARKIDFRTSLMMALVALVLLAAGFLWGYWNRSGFLAEVEYLNSPASMESFCRAHSFQRDGKAACQLPPVWIKGTPQ